MSHERYIVQQGLPFILTLGMLTIIFFVAGPIWGAVLLLLSTFFVTWFFRNPQRVTPDDEKAVISPADGKIIKIEDISDSDVFKEPCKVISVFMNIFNVHVNRIPYSGTVDVIRYDKGKFFSANLDKASKLNERNMVSITSDDGRQILTVQIAGLIARRIVCWLEEGTRVKKGDRFGLIRFGSRLDVYLPTDSTIAVRIGDKVRAGETTIGWLK